MAIFFGHRYIIYTKLIIILCRKEISLLIITDNYLSLKHMGNIKILCFLVITFISCIYIVIIIVLVMYNNNYYYSNNKYYDNHAN